MSTTSAYIVKQRGGEVKGSPTTGAVLPTPLRRDVERFWAHVDTSGSRDACWPRRTRTGPARTRGNFSYGTPRRQVNAHRLSYELLVGPVPAGFHVRHRCEVKSCSYPAHLVLMSPHDHSRLTQAQRRSQVLEVLP
jgi:hypothetical protein